MSNYAVTTRYATALLEFSEENNTFEKVAVDMEFVFNTFKSSRELKLFMANPIISQNKKSQILQEIFEKHISKGALEFLEFMIKKDRDEIVFDTLKRFLELKNAKMNIVNVTVISALELIDTQKNHLVKQLSDFTKKKVKVTYKVDKKILGGFTAKIGDTVLDASVLHQLDLLRKRLLNQETLFN